VLIKIYRKDHITVFARYLYLSCQ